jgi:DnaK suppressor protein
MDTAKARELLRLDRLRTQQLLMDLTARGQEDRAAADQPGDMFDSAGPLVDEGLDNSVATELQRHLAAIERAERRIDAGTFGCSVRSGVTIPDNRLEADPTAELTIEEARQAESTSI